jgi:phosphatidylinositol-3-phosphatase
MRRAALVAAAALLLAGCSSASSAPDPAAGGSGPGTAAPGSSTVPSAPGAVPAPAHVLVVVFENEDAESVVGAPDAPYLTSLAGQSASFTDAHGETHPSQPNYLALFSGSTHGVTDDSCPQRLHGANLAGQLLAAGRTFAGYSEGLPHAGFTGCSSGDYARKHNPWVNFPDLPPSVNQPLSALPRDPADLPTVAFVVPDLCNDMHDCGVEAGDEWARDHLAPYLAWAQRNDSLLVVTFDEDEGSSGNHIATILAGPMVRPGEYDQRIDHYSLLRTMEEMYGLAPLGAAADRAPITGVWSR